MEHYSQLIHLIAITMGVAWASGINLYATLLSLGLMSQFGYVELPIELAVLSDPLVIMASGLMYMVEFVADKTQIGRAHVRTPVTEKSRMPSSA